MNNKIYTFILFALLAIGGVAYGATTGYLINTDTGIITHGDVIKEDIIHGYTAGKPQTAPMGESIIGTYAVLLADDTSEEYANISWHVPENWKAGSDVDIHVHYMNVDAQTGTKSFILGIDYAAVADGEDGTPAETTVEVTETLANNQVAEVMGETQAITLSGANLAVDDTVGIRLYRKAADASDTMTGDLAIDGIHFLYTSDQL